jgi:O-antigen/teichoic acid export membrane protein
LIKKIFSRLSAEPRRNLLIGNGLAQALLFAGIAGISRVYAVETVGAWSASIAFINLIWSFSQLKTDVALLQTQDDLEKKQLLDLGFVSHLLFSAVALLLAHGFGLFVGTDNLLLFSVIASHGIQQLYSAWCLSAHAYTQVNWMRITNIAIAYPGSLLLFLWCGPSGLLWALLIGNILPALMLFISGKVPWLGGSGLRFQWRELVEKHLQTMSFLSLGNFLLSLSEQGMILMISIYYDAGQTAAFFLASRVCNQPLSFVQSAMSQYNMRHFQDLYLEGNFKSTVLWRYWKKWAPAGLLYFLPILVFGPWLFSLIFGANWALAGQFARILGLLAFVRFLNSPTSMGLFIIGKQRIFFQFTIIVTLIFGCTVMFAQFKYPLFEVVMLSSFLQILCILGYNRTMLIEIERSNRA